MIINTKLMHKNGIAVMKLSREILTLQVGDRLSTIAEYSDNFETARGTVQQAIKFLEQNNAIRLEPRGHLGTFITFVDYKVLWEFAGFGTIVGGMPLPYSKKYEGFATGLYKAAMDSDIPFSLAYMRGASERLKALKGDRYDFAVVSKLAANHAIKEKMDLEIAIEYGNYTYVNNHVIIFGDANKSYIEAGMKIGIDRSSIDHFVLTLKQCEGLNVEFINLAYNQIIAKVLSKEIDAAIWNIDDILEKKLDVKYTSIKSSNEEDTEAVIVVNRCNYGIKNVLQHYINMEEVLDCQSKVINGLMIPNY
jgi:hypothetical protein